MDTAVYLAEFVATFVFVLVILTAVARPSAVPSHFQPFLIVMGLFASICIAQGLHSKACAHLNPAVSAVMTVKGDVASWSDFGGLVLAQIAGGLVAYYLHDYMQQQDK
jgi:glycerol uptake facilitator-like aquaporin